MVCFDDTKLHELFVIHIICKYFLPFYGLPFCLVYSFLCCAKYFEFNLDLFIFAYISITLGYGSKIIFCNLCQRIFCLYFFPKNVIISGLTFRSLFHLKFIFVYNIRKRTDFILLHASVQFFQHCFIVGIVFCILYHQKMYKQMLKRLWRKSNTPILLVGL